MTTATPKKTTLEELAARADSATNGDGPPAAGWKPELHEIPVDAIAVGGNVRSPEALDVIELAASIKARGVLSPIRVASIGAGQYELVYGQRRLAAAKVAGLATIPAVVDAEQPSREDRAVAQLIENLQREDLNAVDTAKAYRWLLDKGLSQRQLGEQLGIAQPTIANTLRLLKAPEAIQDRVAAGELTRSHAEAIAKLPDDEQEEVARRIVEHKLSTRDVERELDLAAQRVAEADRERDRAEGDAKKIDKALRETGAAEGATVIVYGAPSSPPPLAGALEAKGWKPKIESTWRTPGGKECDCAAYRISDYADGHTRGKYSVHRVCISKEHEAARNAAMDADRKAANERWAKEHEAAQREREAATKQRQADDELLARWVSGGKAGVERFRAILAALYSEDAWGLDGLVDRHVPEDQRDAINDLDDPVWAVVSKLALPQVMAEFGRFVADAPLGEQARGELLDLARSEEPKPAAKGKKAKAE